MMLEALKTFLYKDRLYQAGEVLAIGGGSEEVRRAVTAVRSGYLARMTIKEAYDRMLQHCRQVGAKGKGEVLEAIRVIFGIGDLTLPSPLTSPPAPLLKERGDRRRSKRGRRGRKVCRLEI
jgi:hypothetical protein